MKKFNRVAIIGVGLIGGSVGLAVRKHRLAREVVGVCRTSRSVRLAKRRKAVDWGTTSVAHAVQGADLVILATPIRVIPKLVRRIKPFLKPGALVTDVASTKEKVLREIARSVPKGVSFIGSHPMAGRETKGVASAIPTLFRGQVCFVIREPRSSPSSLRKVSDFWKRLGCRVQLLSAKEHDRLVSSLSHLPHLVAALLVLNAENVESAGTGFKDMTRIVSSDPSLWRDILLSNRREILRSLGRFQKRLDQTTSFLEKEKWQPLMDALQRAKRLRDRLNR